MLKNSLILVTLLTVIIGLTQLTDKKSFNNSTKIMNDFEFTDIQSSTHTFYDYKGKAVIVHFWATWCAPCVEEFPDLIKLAQKNPNNLTLLAIAVANKPADIQKFIKKISNDLPANVIIGLDSDKKISKELFGTVKLPESHIFTSGLHLREKIIGAKSDWPTYTPSSGISP